MSGRELLTWINDDRVGSLREENGLWAFQYSSRWLGQARSYALSPHLPLQAAPHLDGASLRHVQWYFDNLLPEEGQRTLLARDARIDEADAFGLLSYYGAESAGSVTLLPADQSVAATGQLLPLSRPALSERIRRLPRVSLGQQSPKRMSLAGAQHKLAVVLQHGDLFEPAGSIPSTHILKPDHPDADYPHSVANEYFTMRLADRLGLDVPGVRRLYVPEPVYLIDRFDRDEQGGNWQRRHLIDACQLLGLERSFKYDQGSLARLAELANACRSPAVARTRLFSWLIFNVLTGNSDAHLKNLSFLVSDEGIQLAPHYDLLSVAVYDSKTFEKSDWPHLTRLAWPVLDRTFFSDLDRRVVLEAGAALNLAKTTASRLLDHQLERIMATVESLISEIEAENILLAESRPEIGPTFAGELRCLRAIHHVIVGEMVAKLKN